MNPLDWNWHDPATYFFAAYTIARLASHVVAPNTVVGRFVRWILGNTTPPNPPVRTGGPVQNFPVDGG